MRIRPVCVRALFYAAVFALAPLCALAQTTGLNTVPPIPPVANPCPRAAAGGVIQQPPALFSSNGVLNVQFSYQTTTDRYGNPLYCLMTPSGFEEPTLHVNPGDTLNITLTNNTPASPHDEAFNPPNCGADYMTTTSTNIHFHGTNTSPACGSDNVVKTLVNSGQTFQYSVAFPANETTGLFWYHGHVHGLSEASVQGGASGLIVVDGIQNVQPAVSGLRQRLFVVRDQPTIQGLPESSPTVSGDVEVPNLDLTTNYIPENAMTNAAGVTTFTPAILDMMPGETQFWRICNCSSDTILNLQLLFNGVPQTFRIVAIDGVPVNSQSGTQPGQLIPAANFILPPASRVEILATAPASASVLAQLVTNYINTGPLGDEDPTRPLFTVNLSNTDSDVASLDDFVPAYTALNTNQQLFAGLGNQAITAYRTLYFSELSDGSAFYMNVIGQPYPLNTAFNNNNPPAIVTTQGAVEQWTVQNQAEEDHEFHEHQIHFQVLSQNNFEANGSAQEPALNGQFADMVQVPFWNGNAATPFPDVQLLLDFRGMDIGDFVFHCHILGHEDLGMMAIMQVNPPPSTQVEPLKNERTAISADGKANPSLATPEPDISQRSRMTGGG
jgi:FtsP/CotA-like multicopper oxidase with cupredoxin domain